MNSFLCDLRVRLPAISDTDIYLCLAGKIRPDDYPIGTIVNVYYAQRETGLKSVEIHLIDDPPADVGRVAGIFKKTAIVIFCIAVILAIVGIAATII